MYDAFISYTHGPDDWLAQALRSELHRFAKRWYGLRALRVYRHKSNQGASAALWSSTEASLSSSRYLILLACPESAASPWVQKEIAWWVENRSVETLLLAATHGEIAWDSDTNDFSWDKTTCLPRALRGAFAGDPR